MLSDCCGAGAAESLEIHPEYKIEVPVITCSACDLMYTDYRTEELIKKHLLQNPHFSNTVNNG